MDRNGTARRLVSLAALVAALGAASGEGRAQTGEVVDRTTLRVCADPNNLPFSNKAGEGFENKIADLIAAELGVPVRYTWYPQATGFIRQTLRARKCDLVIGIPTANEMLQNTNPYYRSSYVMVYRSGSGITATTVGDPQLKSLRFGVVAGTPPASLLARYGLMDRVRPYQLTVDTRVDSPGREMIRHLAAGEIDVALLWGPIAGYYAKAHNPAFTIVPLRNVPGSPRLQFRFSMGLRFNEPDWKHRLNQLIKNKQAEIKTLLLEYGVPLLDDAGEPIRR